MIHALLLSIAAASTPSQTFWFVSPPLDAASTPSLAIVGPPALDTIYSPLHVLASPPDAMASAGTAVWVLPAGMGGQSKILRSLRATWDTGLEAWIAEPAEGLARLPAWPGEGVLTHVIGTQLGPSVIVQQGDADAYRIWSLRRGEWLERTTVAVQTSERVLLAAEEADDLVLLVGDDSSFAMLRAVDIESPWQRTQLEATDGQPCDLIFHDGNPLLGFQYANDSRRLGYVQKGKILPWAELVDVPEKARLVRGKEGLLLFHLGLDGPQVRLAEPGSKWHTLARSTGLSGAFWSVFVLLGIAVVVVVMLLAGRGAGGDVVPKGCRVAPLSRRIIAVLLDLVPGLLVCVAVLGSGSIEVLSALLAGPMPSTLPTLSIMAAVTAGWGFAWEATLGHSPSKRLLALRVVPSRGEQLQCWQALVRNVLKGVVIMAPPLAILIILTPLAQAPGDIVARTLVIDAGPSRPDGPPIDDPPA